MTGGSTEVSKKIRAAIKAKLEELGVYVDEELPDYIMVMIANKKEKAQMKEDLLLFLGKNSGKFVDWLFDIFERLQSASTSNPPQESSDNKRKENEISGVGRRKELEVPSKREKVEILSKREKVETTVEEKKKKRDGVDRSRGSVKEYDRKEKERERGTKEGEKKENDKNISIAKVVKSKPHRTEKLPVSPLQKTHRRRKSETPERKASSHFTLNRDDIDRGDRKNMQARAKLEDKKERDLREDVRDFRKRDEEKDKRVKKNTSTSKLLSDSAQESSQQRKRKASPQSSLLDKDIDEEERLIEEESTRIIQSKKVQSSAVVKLPPEPTVRSVSSQVIVKRKLPEKEVTSKQSRGVKSLFLKAIKEAGETTRTASQIAGYGGGMVVKKEKESGDHGKHKQNDSNILDEEESIEIDVYDDIGDTLVVMPNEANSGSANSRSIVQTTDECNGSEPEVERKRPRISGPSAGDEPKFYITLKGDSISGLAKRLTKISEGNVEIVSQKTKTRRRRNEGNPILAHLNLSQSGSVRREVTREKNVIKNNVESGEHLIASPDEVSNDTKPLPAWDLQIQLPEDDTSDEGEDDGDDEAQIDAVLASAQTGQCFDEVPPTPTLSNPAFRPQTPPPQLFYNAPRLNVFTLNRQASNTSLYSSTGTEKIMERCKFWPNCSLQNCFYIHPSKPCSNFPNCSFGDRCIYIHPFCKFDHLCTNPKCSFVHTLKSKTTATTTVSTVPTSLSSVTTSAPSYSANIPCKYGGKCANTSCSFKHPKLCRFGDHCMNRTCYFWHPKASATAVLNATSAKFKWKSPSVPKT